MLSLLRHADLFAPAARGRVDLLVGGGRVLAIGERLDALPTSVAHETIDVAGRRVVPGLLDAHVHVTGGGGEMGPSTRVPPVQLSTIARAGVTTVVGLLGTDGTTRSVADLVGKTLGLREEGLSAYCFTGGYEVPVKTLTGSVRSDICFVDPILGVGELALSDHRSSQPTFDELARIAADCHVAAMMSGKAGLLHLHMGDGPRGLALVRRLLDETELPAATLQPTHVNRKRRLLDEAIGLARTHGLPFDVTSFPVEPPPNGTLGASEPGLEDEVAAADAIARALAETGDDACPAHLVTCSSDACGCLPTFDADGRIVAMDVGRSQTLVDTLRDLLQRDLPLERALLPFTQSVADRLRLPRKGRLSVGSDADLVILDSAARPAHVMARGRWLVRDGEPIVRGRFETTLP